MKVKLGLLVEADTPVRSKLKVAEKLTEELEKLGYRVKVTWSTEDLEELAGRINNVANQIKEVNAKLPGLSSH